MPTQQVTGLKELSKKLSQLGQQAGGRILRSAAMRSTLPALRAAKAAAPVADPPYEYEYGASTPYPRKTYKGRYVLPGFASRNIARKSRLSRDKRTAIVLLGVKPEAFYAVTFIELGTSRVKKQPWLEPSFRASRFQVVDRFGAIMRDKINKVARR